MRQTNVPIDNAVPGSTNRQYKEEIHIHDDIS